MYFKAFLSENKNTILIILSAVVILYYLKYRADKAEQQRAKFYTEISAEIESITAKIKQ